MYNKMQQICITANVIVRIFECVKNITLIVNNITVIYIMKHR